LKLKVIIGFLISAVFIYLTFRQVEFEKMFEALRTAKYYWLIPALLLMACSHWLRALRWQYLIEPIKKIKVMPLFEALIIGYAANNVFPLRLGEFFRAFVIGKSQNISKSSAFATVIVERFILDLLALLTLLLGTILFYPSQLPYDDLIRLGGYIILGVCVTLLILIILLIQKTDVTLSFLQSKLPGKIYEKVEPAIQSFVKGCLVFKNAHHYLAIIFLTVLIWTLYLFSLYIMFFVFDFVEQYQLNLWSAVVILVVVTFSIMLPSSPGAVGTYHFLCTEVLNYFQVPNDQAVSFAIVSHAMNIVPFTLLGLFYFLKGNLKFSDALSEKKLAEEGSSKHF